MVFKLRGLLFTDMSLDSRLDPGWPLRLPRQHKRDIYIQRCTYSFYVEVDTENIVLIEIVATDLEGTNWLGLQRIVCDDS